MNLITSKNGASRLKTVALYKAFSGNEFVKASIASIYSHVDKIVFIHSDVSWLGETGNDVMLPVEIWKAEHDSEDKIVQEIGTYRSQEEQYARGLDLIKTHYPCDYILIIDTDEVWEDEPLSTLLSYVAMDQNVDAVRCRMHTYIKDVHYRITPPEPCTPVVLVKSDIKEFAGVRGNNIQPSATLETVFFHHFTLIRRNEEDIFKKIIASNKGDGMEHVNIDKWREEVWDKIPDVKNFHMTKGYEHCWQQLVTVTDNELPII